MEREKKYEDIWLNPWSNQTMRYKKIFLRDSFYCVKTAPSSVRLKVEGWKVKKEGVGLKEKKGIGLKVMMGDIFLDIVNFIWGDVIVLLVSTVRFFTWWAYFL